MDALCRDIGKLTWQELDIEEAWLIELLSNDEDWEKTRSPTEDSGFHDNLSPLIRKSNGYGEFIEGDS